MFSPRLLDVSKNIGVAVQLRNLPLLQQIFKMYRGGNSSTPIQLYYDYVQSAVSRNVPQRQRYSPYGMNTSAPAQHAYNQGQQHQYPFNQNFSPSSYNPLAQQYRAYGQQSQLDQNQSNFNRSGPYVRNRGHHRGQSGRWSPKQKQQRPSLIDTPDNPNNPLPVMPRSPQSPAESRNNKMSEQIWKFYQLNRQTSEDFKKKMHLRNVMFEIIRETLPHAGLYIVGSSMTGFATHNSDMDMCLMLSTEEITKRESIEILRKLDKSFRKCNFVRESIVIRATCPILKFVDRLTNIEVDLNINNCVGIRNTHLLRSYADLDWRVRPLMLMTKYWARVHDINDASRSTISSYSFCMMLIHYLQYACKPPVLSCLQSGHPRLFGNDIPTTELKMNETIKFQSENNDSLGTLFLGFLQYYAKVFDFKADVGSIRTAEKIPWQVFSKLPKCPYGQWKFLKMEEPFNGSNTARSCHNEDEFARVVNAIQTSFNTLNRKRDVQTILS